ncbi:MAG: hypothetical protein A2908_04440 [Candidatus Staskawiczbacteria bacterium RIFCSPLOWO2_01_FULL_38_12b]|uniref:UPF0102 protein A2908_04440 n=1 Tax=Candidatus Staskawiczbacteria bacterium RIFCSPLOWO2_01_FULL_38_12b TaxID=1802214 RepID=A0A1G2IBG6_9BACT|nr:MAG: hypothetical protein A2908_04440 [Candidatus Staskawiczbacteria bacterium RIFCSPLOWO2_01_FULL_38_12b]
MGTKELGDLGERLACEYLVKKGFNILGKNWRTRLCGQVIFGELDIIARKKFKFFTHADKTIHFVEVKTIIGSDDSFFPEDHVNYKKQQKLKNLAQIWLQKNKYPQNIPHQIDVIGILVDEELRNAKLHYFGNVVEG